jgi:hypothetical protein
VNLTQEMVRLARFALGMPGDLHLGERFRFFGELASSLEAGRNGGPRAGLDEKQLYVHQGFFGGEGGTLACETRSASEDGPDGEKH